MARTFSFRLFLTPDQWARWLTGFLDLAEDPDTGHGPPADHPYE